MLVLVGQYGLLCNRLFTYANLLAFSREHGIGFVNPGFHDYAHLFPTTSGTTYMTAPMNWCGRKALALCRRIAPHRTLCIGWRDPLYLDAPENRDTVMRVLQPGLHLLDGFYFIDRVAFPKHAETIRAFFQPPAGDRAAATASVARARATAAIVVGVHVRLGDYRTFQRGAFLFDAAAYARAMRACVGLYPGRSVGFVVVSNEPVDVADFPLPHVVAGPGSMLGDLHAHAQCDAIVGPPSTYSQWASFLGEVPRFTMHRSQIAPRTLGDFVVHTKGFGKYV